MTSRLKILLIILIVLAGIGFFGYKYFFKFIFAPTGTHFPIGVKRSSIKQEDIKIIAENLQIPWEIEFLPDGDILVTERPGNLRRIGKDGQIYKIEGVEPIGEGGLLGMALHPKFFENNWIYLYLTTKSDDDLKNQAVRYKLDNDKLSDKIIVLDDIPGAALHDGGRIAFGPAYASDEALAGKSDYYLYITTGDSGNSDLAQNKKSLAGKILRVKDDGAIPSDNPFGNAVYSYGHRNSQGLTWDDLGRLWATEHGRSGTSSGYDELNLIEKGKNYGWSEIQGNDTKMGMEAPIIQSGPDETWAPAGMAFVKGSLFFGGLRGESLYEAKIVSDKKVDLKVHFREDFGRIRAVKIGPDGFLYITTSNTDGRGDSKPGDDKIIRINPWLFEK